MHKPGDLRIWRKANEIAAAVYKATADFPKEEKYRLTSQIRRSALSIPSNVAEGAGRTSIVEFCLFLDISNASSYELQTQLIIASQLQLIDNKISAPLLKKLDELQKMTYAFTNTLKGNRKG